MDEMTRGLADKGGTVPVFLGKASGGVEGVSTGSGEAAVEIDLANRFRDRVNLLVVFDARAALAVPAAHVLEVLVRNGHVNAVLVVRGGGEYQTRFAQAESPGV